MIPPRSSASRRGLDMQHGVDSRRFKVLRAVSIPMPPPALVPVILSGGAGTRLWPLSREMAPKAFMRLPDGDTLLAKTAARALSLPGVTELLTVTNRELYFHTKDLYAGLGARGPRDASYILEPFGRNTAPAVALAAMAVEARHGGDAVMLVLPADHLIQRSGCVRCGGRARGGARTRGTPRDVRDRADARRNGIRLSRMRGCARRFRHDARRISRPPFRRKARRRDGALISCRREISSGTPACSASPRQPFSPRSPATPRRCSRRRGAARSRPARRDAADAGDRPRSLRSRFPMCRSTTR